MMPRIVSVDGAITALVLGITGPIRRIGAAIPRINAVEQGFAAMASGITVPIPRVIAWTCGIAAVILEIKPPIPSPDVEAVAATAFFFGSDHTESHGFSKKRHELVRACPKQPFSMHLEGRRDNPAPP